MEHQEFLKRVLPSFVIDHFDIVNIENDEKNMRLDLFLEEKKIIPPELKHKKIISHGFTQECVVQDFPIRGKGVYLHIKRRKWLNTDTQTVHSRKYDATTYKGTQLTPEFVAFLKEMHR